MVTVFLRGGLGNQMFQYAAGFAAARRNGTDVVIDTTLLNDRTPRKNFTYRAYDLDVFGLTPRFTTLSELSVRFPLSGLWFGVDAVSVAVGNLIGVRRVIKEGSVRRFNFPIGAKKNLVLWGFWQSPEYFEGIEKEIRHQFNFRVPLSGEAKELGEKIIATNSVAVHVRRGDYLTATSQRNLPVAGLEYYRRAAEYVVDRVIDPHFYVFSDDIAWCRESVKLPQAVTFVSDSLAGPKSSFHLQLMALCKHAVIANSTYSWWGAWLNTNPDKIVVAPKRWYWDRDPREGLIPKTWTII
jgi:hypothetical protein